MEGLRTSRAAAISHRSYAESAGSLSPNESPNKNDMYQDDGEELDYDDDEELDEGHYIGQPRPRYNVDDEEDDEEDEAEYDPAASHPDRSSRGYSLRAKPNVSLKGAESAKARSGLPPKRVKVVTTRGKRGPYKKTGKGPGRPSKKASQDTTGLTQRNLVRHHISHVTTVKRERFMLHHKNLFLPLLPERNYIGKLEEKHTAILNSPEPLSTDDMSSLYPIVPYQEIETQPRGIKATMKPYQLSGLSFMVYLHQNGLSGILGDEMGLGKTLQTISLIQYLRENEPLVGEMHCPFLVICPLSVLSSWMNELARWAPGLNVIRFHGPVKERNRLKRVAMGEIDQYGNETFKYKSKANARLTARGKEVIDLDAEEDTDSGEVDVVVTTYESYLAEQSWIKRAFVWRYVILDEGHKIKNDLSLVSKALQGLSAEHRLILTGTPLQNNLQELWALLHWLYPEPFNQNTSELFSNSFDLGRGKYSDEVVDCSRKLLELIMLRRMKNSPGVNLNLPPKTEVLLFVPLAPMQRFWYTRLITRADAGLLEDLFKGAKDKEVNSLEKEDDAEAAFIDQQAEVLASLNQDLVEGSDEWKESKAILKRTLEREEASSQEGTGSKASSWRNLMNLMMQLRKVSTHPYQIRNAAPDPYETGEHIITASGKFLVLEKLVMELVVKQRKKILIFSGFTKVLDLVEEFLALKGGGGKDFRSIRLDGRTGRARRNLGIRLFNKVDSEYRIMLISTRAGGLGINLATASDVILLDQDWNPQITLQAEARAHRIGQTNPVTVYKLVSQGTVEEQMMGRIQKKLYLSAKVTEAMEDIHTSTARKSKGKGRATGADDENMPNMSVGQLMTLVRRGTAAVSRPEVDVNEMMSWDWEKCLEMCKDKPLDVQIQKDAVPNSTVDKEAEAKWLSEMERVESTIFEGKRLARDKRGGINNSDIKEEWAELDHASRREGKNTTVMVDGFAIDKRTLNNAKWEAVSTMAGKDHRLANPIREKRAKINNQAHCQVCLDGGEIFLCQHCPRSYHLDCLDDESKLRAHSTIFICPQHQCNECDQKTADAGGMLYRCRWCEKAFCEDCLQWERTELIGENLIEYEVLTYPSTSQAFYIVCHQCTKHHEDYPEDKRFSDEIARDAARRHALMFHNSAPSSRAGSLTDATTIDTSGVATPAVIPDDDDEEVVEVARPKTILKFRKTTTTAVKATNSRENQSTATTSPSPSPIDDDDDDLDNNTPRKSKRKVGEDYSSDLTRTDSGVKQKLFKSKA